MEDVAATARAKIEALKQQIIELEQFLKVYEELSHSETHLIAPQGETGLASYQNGTGNKTPHKPVDKSRRRRRSRMKPDAVSDLMARIIREVGKPMTRGDIVAAFESRDVEIPFADKGRYIGTIAWRNKGRFVNIEGQGYWLRDEPLNIADKTSVEVTNKRRLELE